MGSHSVTSHPAEVTFTPFHTGTNNRASLWSAYFLSKFALLFSARCSIADAMHPRYYPWPCVCPSVTSRSSTKTAERIELVFGVWASFHPSYTVLKGYSVISKNNGTSLWNFVLNSGLRKFRHSISIVETCYQLSSRKVDAQSVINWAVVGQLSR